MWVRARAASSKDTVSLVSGMFSSRFGSWVRVPVRSCASSSPVRLITVFKDLKPSILREYIYMYGPLEWPDIKRSSAAQLYIIYRKTQHI